MQHPLTAEVGTTSTVAEVAQSVQFACGLQATEMVSFSCPMGLLVLPLTSPVQTLSFRGQCKESSLYQVRAPLAVGYVPMFQQYPDFLLTQHDKQTPWPSVRKQTIPTERPLLVGE
jgi:hypothetical protein